jgi:hypothetical protein
VIAVGDSSVKVGAARSLSDLYRVNLSLGCKQKLSRAVNDNLGLEDT